MKGTVLRCSVDVPFLQYFSVTCCWLNNWGMIQCCNNGAPRWLYDQPCRLSTHPWSKACWHWNARSQHWMYNNECLDHNALPLDHGVFHMTWMHLFRTPYYSKTGAYPDAYTNGDRTKRVSCGSRISPILIINCVEARYFGTVLWRDNQIKEMADLCKK